MEERKPIHDFHDLEVYKRAYSLALQVHKESERWPQEGRHGVADQLRGAAWSVPANIAEGYGRKTFEKDFKRFLVTSLGSASEATMFLDAVRDLGWLSESRHQALTEEYIVVMKQLHTLLRRWTTYDTAR